MILAGDIGATNCRLAVFDSNLSAVAQGFYKCKDYSSFEDVVRHFLQTCEHPIESACFGVPGPVIEGRCKLTNVPWEVSAATLAEVTGSPVTLLNDVEANAYGLETLRDDELVTLNAGSKLPGGNRVVVAVGTSVGEAALIDVGGRIHALASEGGHADFGPFDEEQWQLLRYTQRQYQRVSYEVLLGGQGLVQIYNFLRDSGYGVTPEWLEQEMQNGDPAASISNAALSGKCQLCVRALDMFVSILAAEAGNAAVKFLATGGVYLGGGISPRILDKLHQPIFLENFVNKDKMRNFLQSVPVYVILNDGAGLQGSAWYAKRAISSVV
jgi:glucokinase